MGFQPCSRRSKVFTAVMASFCRGCYYLLCAVVVTLCVLTSVVAKQSVPQILEKNGLPKGLLPATVSSYTLAENGKFQVNLRSTCTTKWGPEEVYYKKKITGELSYKTINKLDGIQVHEWFWFSVTDIEVDKIVPNIIKFKIGYVSKSFNTDVFDEPPVCNSLVEEDEPKDALTFAEWLSRALDGTLEVNVLNSLNMGAARKLLQ
jgi:hypothetical protein